MTKHEIELLLAKYDECSECGLPRFQHEGGHNNVAGIPRDCPGFTPSHDGWMVLTRTTLQSLGVVCGMYPHDLPEGDRNG